MELVKRLPLMLLISAGLLFFGLGCDDDPEEPPLGEILLSLHLLDFGNAETELQFFVTNIGDSTLVWNISSIPDWAQATPDSGTLVEDDTTWITVQIQRDSLDSGTTTGSLVVHTDANDDSLTLSVQRILVGHLTLETNALDFGAAVAEQQLTLLNTGDDSLTWTVSGASIPYWVEITPTSGDLAESAQIQITICVDRTGVSPGVTTAALLFLSDANDDSLIVSMQRVCSILGDDFNEGAAAAWNSTALDVSQHDGYVVLDPNSAMEAGRLQQTVSLTTPYTISTKIRRFVQTVDFENHGILL